MPKPRMKRLQMIMIGLLVTLIAATISYGFVRLGMSIGAVGTG